MPPTPGPAASTAYCHQANPARARALRLPARRCPCSCRRPPLPSGAAPTHTQPHRRGALARAAGPSLRLPPALCRGRRYSTAHTARRSQLLRHVGPNPWVWRHPCLCLPTKRRAARTNAQNFSPTPRYQRLVLSLLALELPPGPCWVRPRARARRRCRQHPQAALLRHSGVTASRCDPTPCLNLLLVQAVFLQAV